MTIFSRKQGGKKSDDQPKVIVDGALEAKPTEESPAKEPPAGKANVAGAPAPKVVSSPPVAAEPAAPEPVDPVPSDADEEIEPEAIETPPVLLVEHRFGIDDAIRLMRSLPADPNTSLVVRVVRVTLGAVHVGVEEIVADAVRKETWIKERITALEGQIADLERQLANLRREISTQQADLKETANVRERLHQADPYPHKSLPPPITTAMPRSIPSKPFTS